MCKKILLTLHITFFLYKSYTKVTVVILCLKELGINFFVGVKRVNLKEKQACGI